MAEPQTLDDLLDLIFRSAIVSDVTKGTLEIGHTEDGMVVMNCPPDPTGRCRAEGQHFDFSPRQARNLARSLMRAADEAEKLIPVNANDR